MRICISTKSAFDGLNEPSQVKPFDIPEKGAPKFKPSGIVFQLPCKCRQRAGQSLDAKCAELAKEASPSYPMWLSLVDKGGVQFWTNRAATPFTPGSPTAFRGSTHSARHRCRGPNSQVILAMMVRIFESSDKLSGRPGISTCPPYTRRQRLNLKRVSSGYILPRPLCLERLC